jgi:hypothetical protein
MSAIEGLNGLCADIASGQFVGRCQGLISCDLDPVKVRAHGAVTLRSSELSRCLRLPGERRGSGDLVRRKRPPAEDRGMFESHGAVLSAYHFFCFNALQYLCFDAVFAQDNACGDDSKYPYDFINSRREFMIVFGLG